ncbi:MAG: contractile injection system tape measure protein [Deltaproteobacteria bacterium]|nr:contractile injection system tape measure protein [Deltaproteobacteria bacterium]
MADAPCHIINSTRFNVTLSQDVDEISAPSQLADFFHRIVQPALDKALSGYAADDHDYRIDRLAIDLGTIDIFHPDSAIAEKIRLYLARALQGLEPRQIDPAKPQQRIRESFLNFLQTGQIPWFGAEMTISDLENKIKELVERDIEQMLETLRPLLRRALIRRRLGQQFSLMFVDWLVEKMQPDLVTAFSETIPKFRFKPSAVDRAELLLRVAARVPIESSKYALRGKDSQANS